ncbi:helix-turn-helix transcriptional regulator [uncultured Sphingomonas sp.]|uniref:helix-turn-helix transcriptional regulator n=1 Tax=uncultured Sphingomonas sp. TaxID=158754 RepID=UPI0035CCA95F
MASTAAAAKKLGRPAGAGRFLRIDDVIASTGLSRPTIYRLIRREAFPDRVALTTRCVGWWEADINSWLHERRALLSA